MRYLLLLLPLLSGCASVPREAPPREAQEVSDADRLVRDLCDKQMALLGEESHHGSGRTIAFKAELTRRLVEECHYDAFFIESGFYDFVNIAERLKAGTPVDEPLVAAAIGGMWANQEMAPLVSFLTRRLNAGTLVAGGLDDQIGRGTYAQHQMSAELVPVLEGGRRAECGAMLERHMLWRYDETHPFTVETVQSIRGCLKEMESVLARPGESADEKVQGQLQRVRSLDRFFVRQAATLARESAKEGQGRDWSDFDGRDRSMFMNLEWTLGRFARPRKAIVWLATIHAAKGFKALEGDLRQGTPFGSFVQARWGRDAFVVGFSAHGGSYSLASTLRTYEMEPARADSLEGWAFANHSADTRYLDAKTLRELGPKAARPISYKWLTGPWETVLDGLLVIREENPPSALAR